MVAALAAMGLYYFHREAPLVDTRPAETAAGIHEQVTPQTIVARLWQDPFEAIEKTQDKLGKLAIARQQCEEHSSPQDPCKSPLEEADEGTLVLGVTVPGPPYQEDAERRRRTRYAVLAGLEQAGFVPKDARHLGYFVWVHSPLSVQLEIPPAMPLVSWGPPPAGNRTHSAIKPKLPVFALLQDKSLHLATSLPAKSTTVPYEWFEKTSQDGQPEGKDATKRVLILWLREDFFREEPLTRFSSLFNFINNGNFNENNIRIIGPFSSDILHDMAREAPRKLHGVACDENKNNSSRSCNWFELKNVIFYAYGTSAVDDQLLGALSNQPQSIQDYLNRFGIQLQRTISTDETLASGIVTELNRRRVYPDSGPEHRNDVALISEWDTFYGQTLPKVMERNLAKDDAPHHDWIHKFTYLKGLDGLLPSAESKEETKEDKAASSEEKTGSTTDYFKIETDTQSLERPIGQSQFDYLRRISWHLHKIDGDLRKEGPGKKIRAIGILGGDVFDKLLILRALKPEFPEALFFTTDFDEAYTIKSELPFTRNLIISSSFGPNLSDWLQGDIPFFRDTYETSAFLATQLAAGNLADLQTPNYSPRNLSNQLRAPRLFEVERNGEILPFAWGIPAAFSPKNHEDNPQIAVNDPLTEERSGTPCWKGNDASQCGYIQPVDFTELKAHPNGLKVIETLYPTYEENSRRTLAWGLALLAMLLELLSAFRVVPKGARFEVRLIALCLFAGALTCAFWEPVAQFLTEYGEGEPIIILQGVSVWPTVALRFLGVILSLYFVGQALRSLHKDLNEISTALDLEPKPVSLSWEVIGIHVDIRNLYKYVAGLFDHREGSDQPSIKQTWENYVAQERFWPRCIRVTFATFIMFGIFLYVLLPMFGKPAVPARGVLAFNLYILTTRFDVFLMQFLTFFVFDATLSCLLFVNKLRHGRTEWPLTTMGVYKNRLRLQPNLVHDWIGLDFVAKRTLCIGSLIYFPFVLIALLIVSRTTVFANYAPSLTILIAQGISLTVVFGCAVGLWWVARATRNTAKQNLTDAIIRAKDSEGNAFFAEQLEALLNRVDRLNYGAFSPFMQQPLVRALLFPLSSAGGIALIQNGIFPGL
ncbi:MAG TPA: hypothetical protein VL996_12000 [Methylocella sp.]|nr:hypothetical protein [Methylocella sp.]